MAVGFWDKVSNFGSKVKQGVAQTAGEITQGIEGEVRQTAGQLELRFRAGSRMDLSESALRYDAKFRHT